MHTTITFSALWAPPADLDLVTPAPGTIASNDCRQRSPAPADGDEARHLVMTVARAAVEALTGYRPMGQLSRWLTPTAANGLAMAKRHGNWTDAKVARVWALRSRDDTIDGVAQVATGKTRLALPISLKLRGNRWTCTHLNVLLPGTHMLSD